MSTNFRSPYGSQLASHSTIHPLTEQDIENEDYIFTDKTACVGDTNRKLPRYFPIESTNGTKWMMLRRPLALRLHKFKIRENAHEFYYSELQLYTPFENEEDLFPDDVLKCKDLYEKKLEHINSVKSQVKKI